MVCLGQTVRTVPYTDFNVSDIQLTPTSYIVLGLLSQAGEATPYQLKQMVDYSVGHFWSVPRSQVYAEPARLARAGYLTEGQEADGRRRKQYALTRQGREALERWTSAPTREHTELRDLAFLKLFFGADPVAMAEAQLGALRSLLQFYETVHANEVPDEPSGPRQTLEAGIDYVRTGIRVWERIAREARLNQTQAAGGARGASPSAPRR
jgi:PadR family transcriptional regulator, regulatory protein AphA